MNDLLASGPTPAVIPTLTALTIRHFKHKQGKMAVALSSSRSIQP